jgi:hypothetical protein
MEMNGTRLFDALPASLREADASAGGIAAALFEVIGGEGDRLARAIEELGESWFIETCPEWVIPYIGDLLAVQPLTQTVGFSERSWVAQTIALRRRKGTLGVIGTLSRATTGWPSHPVEMFQRLVTTQTMRHLRQRASASATVRFPEPMRRHDTAFDALPHSLDVRQIARGHGRYNVQNIGIFAWRAQAYPFDAVEAAPAGAGRFLCDPAARELPLWNPPRAVSTADESDLPVLLDRRSLYLDLEGIRTALAAGEPPTPRWFNAQPPLRLWVQMTVGAAFVEVPREELASADLHDVADARGWRRPPSTLSYPDATGAAVSRSITAAIDPVRGRIAFPDGVTPQNVRLSFAHAVPGDLGGGPYDRNASLSARLAGRPVTWQIGVSRRRATVPGVIVATVAEAIAEWKLQPSGTVGIIALLDNDRFAEDLTGARAIRLLRGSMLALVSADWPATPRPGGGSDLLPGSLSAVDRRAAIIGNLSVIGDAPADAIDAGILILDGLLIGGNLTATAAATANLGGLVVAHTTIAGTVTIAGNHDRLTVALDRSCCQGVTATATVPGLDVRESVVLGALTMPGARAAIVGATVTGTTQLQSVSASDSLFVGPLTTARKQIGCLRYSYVPRASSGPRQFRCQPELAIADAGPGADVAAISARVGPMFDSLDPGRADFARLAWRCDPALAAGSENGSAMGAWRFLEEPQRRANLGIALEEYLGLGLEAGLIPAS